MSSAIGYASVVVGAGGFRGESDRELAREGFAACERVYVDRLRSHDAPRPELAAALAELGEGDVFVALSLSCVAKSVPHALRVVDSVLGVGAHLVLLADRVDTRQPEGHLAIRGIRAVATLHADRVRAAKLSGTVGISDNGRPRALSDEQAHTARQLRAEGMSLGKIGIRMGVSKSTVHSYLKLVEDQAELVGS